MGFIFPKNRKEVADRARTDVQNELDRANPFLRNSFLNAKIVGFSGRIFDFYLQLKILTRNMFPDTATIPAFIERWGSYKKITKNPATKAEGSAIIIGDVGSTLPIDTEFSTREGNTYRTTASESSVSNEIAIDSITRSGSIATVTLQDSNPAIATGMLINISGADQPDYNGEFQIQVISLNQFTYAVANNPTTPATGTKLASYNGCKINLRSDGYGQQQNLAQGAILTISSPQGGFESEAIVDFAEIGGGTDIETIEELQARIIDRYQNPISLFNESAIDAQIRSVPGITRAFINEANKPLGFVGVESISKLSTGESADFAIVKTDSNHNLESGQAATIGGAVESEYNVQSERILVIDETTFVYRLLGNPTTPATETGGGITAITTLPAGQVQIYFMRDNDEDPIPSASEVNAAKEKLLEIKPAHVADIDVIVKAPVGVVVDVSFSELSPNNSTIQSAINANIEAFFRDETEVAKSISLKKIESVILQTVDKETGESVKDFTLSTPTAEIEIGVGEIAVVGDVSYP